MINVNDFCTRAVDAMTMYLYERYGMFPAQSKESCKAILKNCFDIEPDYVLDIGTNYGLSTLSLAYALKLLGKDLSVLTTIDCNQDHWIKETPIIQKGLLLNSEIDINEIQVIQKDFILLSPMEIIKGGKVLVFYDIHDTVSVSYMEKFINEWIPLFDYGYIMVHDCYIPPSAYWIDRNDPIYPISSARHFSGITFEGYKECKILIDWLNSQKCNIFSIPETSIIRFAI